ncbi:MAG: GAF domain-containing protein, partial [Nannocystaceae bacterium]
MPEADPLAPFGHDGFVTLTLGELERVMHRYRSGTFVRQSAESELASLRTAMSRLHPMASDPLIALHLEWIEAVVRWLEGAVVAAHRGWSAATRRAHRLDAPRVLASISRFRAHALIEEGAQEAGLREAKVAAEIARKQGMVTLDSWIRSDFNLIEQSQHDSADTLVSVGTGNDGPDSHRIHQHFETLLQIRMSALRESSAQRQAKAILAELMLALGASRGWMLAYTGNASEMELVYGCTADGDELMEIDAASQDVVEQTRSTGELTIGSAPHNDAFDGTKSNLWSATTRSIMGAPIRLGERIAGVVCLDNRMSGNPFSRADEQMLQATAGHIALAGEVLTARLRVRSQSIQHGLVEVLEQASQTLAVGVVALGPNGNFVHTSPAIVDLTAAWGEPAVWWRVLLESEQIDPDWVGLGDGAMHIVRVVADVPDGSRRIFEISFTGQVRQIVGFGPSQVVLVADTTARSITEINLRDRCDSLAA